MKIDNTTTAVVTGAASGIGRAMALRLASFGASLALADIDKSGLDETTRLIRTNDKFHAKVTAHIVDVSDRNQMATFANDVLREHSNINLLINNAGASVVGDITDLSIDDIEWLMKINFFGVVHGIICFLPTLLRQPKAHIVNTSSIFGLIALPGQSIYSASKFAVRGFTEALKIELSDTNITVTTVLPGGTKTNIARNARPAAGTGAASVKEAELVFDKAARMSPDRVADRIIRGITRDQERILIGFETYFVDLLQRLMPVKYWRILGPMMDMLTGAPYDERHKIAKS